jgi:hypothetical protein
LYGLPADGKVQWCASCARGHIGVVDLMNKNMKKYRPKCVDCKQVHQSYGLPADGKVQWCAGCAKEHARAVDADSTKCVDCKRVQPSYGLPDGKKQWCAGCAEGHARAVACIGPILRVLREKVRLVGKDKGVTQSVLTDPTQLYHEVNGLRQRFVQLQLNLHPEMITTPLLHGELEHNAGAHETQICDEGGVDYVGMTLYVGHDATTLSDAVAREETCASVGVDAKLWPTIAQVMKARKQGSYAGTKASHKYLLHATRSDKRSARRIVW